MTYISVESIFQLLYINRNDVDKDHFMELAWYAYEKFAHNANYERKTCMIDIDNYKGKLPTGLWKLEVVARMIPANMEQAHEWLLTTLDIDAGDTETTVTYNTSTLTSNSIRGNSAQGINYDRTTSIISQKIIENSGYVMGNADFKKYFELMEFTSSPFMVDRHCPYSPNFNWCCGEKYSISPNNEVLTSFDTGKIYISYLSYPVDENGHLLIPDDADVKEAIVSYLLMHYWENRVNNAMDKGAFQMWQTYLNKWEKLCMKTKGNLNIQNLNQQAILFHADRYKHIVGAEDVWHRQDWYKYTNYKIRTP